MPMNMIIAFITAKINIKVIFIQKEFETRNAEQMAQETGARIIQIDPLEENWMKQMKELLIKLKDLDN